MKFVEKIKKLDLLKLSIFLIFFALHSVISLASDTPLIYADEAGYIGNARLLLFDQMESTKYFPGYSFLIAPIFLVTNKIEIAYQIIQIVNSFIMAFVPIFLIKILKILDNELSLKKIYIVSIVASLYPSSLLYSNFAMTEPVIITTFLFCVIIFAKLLENSSRKFYWVLFWFLVFYLVLVHPRNVVILPAAIIVLTLKYISSVWPKLTKNKKTILLFLLVSTIILIVSIILLVVYKTEYAKDFEDKLEKIFSIDGITGLVLILLGQSFYLTLASFGVGAIGFYVAVMMFFKGILNQNPDVRRKTWIVGFVLLSFIFGLLLSSWYMSTPDRADHVLYGRYNESSFLPILLLGFMYFAKFRKANLPIITVIVHLIVSLLFIIEKKEFLETESINWANILSLYLYNLFYSHFNIVHLFLFYTLLMIIIFLLGDRKPIFFATVACIFIITAAFANYHYFYRGSVSRSEQKSLVNVIRIYKDLNDEDEYIKIYFDKNVDSFWHYYNYITYVPEIKMIHFDSASNLNLDPNFADLVITNKIDFNSIYPGAKLIGIENHFPIYLWVLPGKNQDYFEKNGFTARDGFPQVLPINAYKSDIRVSGNKDIKITSKRISIPLTVKHDGSEAFWANSFSLGNNLYSIRVGAILYDSTGKVVYEGRANLPTILYPGDQVDVELVINLDKVGEHLSIKDNYYTVKVGMVHEGVAWFHNFGDEYLEINLSP